MILKKLTISNFKGIASREIAFNSETVISGQNGVGKTTIMDAWFWLMSGKDSALTDNPAIVPIGMDEVNPTVEAVCDIDGKEITIRKVQKYKNKDGKESTTNQYIVNEVPMTERDFKAKLEEYGIDDKFLVLSHPDYLLRDNSKKGREYVRNQILFPMAQTFTDAEIAKKNKLKELSAKLADYRLAEIEAMSKATLKRINDEIGKDNVIANARIDELSKMKFDVVQEKQTKAKIDALNAKLGAIEIKKTENESKIEALKNEVMQLHFDKSEYMNAQNADFSHKMVELDKSIGEAEKLQNQANNEVTRVNILINVKQETIVASESRIKYLKDKRKYLGESVFDDKKTICPTCGQKYPASMANEIRNHFKMEHDADLASVNEEIKEHEKICDKNKAEIAELYAERDEHTRKAKEYGKQIKELQKQSSNASAPDITKTDGYKAFEKQITDREKEIAKLQSTDFEKDIFNLNCEIGHLNIDLLHAEQNKRFDDEIKAIRQKIVDAEVNRADAEKMLYQIECLNKAKNEMMEESVNSHFKLVKWKLFRTLKNGSTEDACIPVIDGYEVGTGKANHGREVLAKIDIIDGLSRFYKKLYPVFLDNAESLSGITNDRIDIENQLIMFKVSEDKELKEV